MAVETKNSGKKKEKKKKYFCDIKLRRGGCLDFSSVRQIEECCVECELSFAVVRWWCFPPSIILHRTRFAVQQKYGECEKYSHD